MQGISGDDGCGGFIHMADEFARADSPTAVYRALTAFLADTFGADCAVVVERCPDRHGDYHAFTPAPAGAGPGVAGLAGVAPFKLIWPLAGTGKVCRDDTGPTTPYRPLLEAFTPPDPCCLVHLPLGDGAVVILVFRDRDPALKAADWRLLEAAVRQAAAAIERTDALRRVRELTLQDPETGVGNLRLLEIVLRHSFAHAQRGAPLSIVSIVPAGPSEQSKSDVDGRLASLLRSQARGADVVARVDEGVFVVVLPAASAEGAGIFLKRVMTAAGDAALRFGLAEHDGRYHDSSAMLQSVLAQAGVSSMRH
jgi:GGDEF domain-containing protein